ncbi:MAG TPA: CoA-transferase [Candidatus Acidoferrales bacterium]|nr:CoA-transferase [Candidatus Acidoferrales bacterium]
MRELMVIAAAREIRDGELAFVGMRLPLLGFAVAKELYAPRAIGVFENGIVRDWPALAPIFTMSDPPNVARALYCGGLIDVMGLLQSGRVQLGFIGGAEIDRFGNVNTHWVRERQKRTRLPGSGGAADIATLAERCIVIMSQERRRFPPRVEFVTSPGYGEGAAWRERARLKGGGPSRVITTMATFSFDPESREMILSTVHPGATVADVQRETGWPLRVAANIGTTAPPSAEELAVLRKYDPNGIWTS